MNDFIPINEREKYHLRRYKARRSPSKYLTLILDGMDQSKTDVPNERRICKSSANLQKLRTHLVGAILHSGLSPMGKIFLGCFDIFQWKHDSNLTMNILLILLETFNNRFGLPPVLNLQLDNCWRENKNKFVFTLLSLLIEWSVFDKVKQDYPSIPGRNIKVLYRVAIPFTKMSDNIFGAFKTWQHLCY